MHLAIPTTQVRNPLSGIVGNCALLGETELTAEQSDYVRDMECSCLQMKTVVGDVLDLHKVQAGRMELEAAEFEVTAVVGAAISQVKAAAVAKGVTIAAALERDGVPLRLLGDSGRITQMLSNYLSNAVKFSPAGTGIVAIFIYHVPCTTPGHVRLRWVVRDNGCGLQVRQPRCLMRVVVAPRATTSIRNGIVRRPRGPSRRVTAARALRSLCPAARTSYRRSTRFPACSGRINKPALRSRAFTAARVRDSLAHFHMPDHR